MPRNKRSFFERLTGAINVDDYDEDFEDADGYADDRRVPLQNTGGSPAHVPLSGQIPETPARNWMEEENGEGQLTVDVYQTPDNIVIRAHVAGVRPEDLDISITRDMVTIKGKREEAKEVSEDNYFYKELYWGAFSRTVLLPQEIEVEGAEAVEKHGLLTLRLPKIDKEKHTKVKVKGA